MDLNYRRINTECWETFLGNVSPLCLNILVNETNLSSLNTTLSISNYQQHVSSIKAIFRLNAYSE
jgi:hypothetical protein